LKKKVLVFGATGLLGFNLIYQWRKYFKIYANENKSKIYINNVTYVKISNQNKTNDYKIILSKVKKINPELIINCAAFTNIDECEKKINTSFKINYQFPDILSSVCNELNIKFVHISTDQLFGISKKNKNENTKPFPINVYGRHKLLAEKKILENNPLALIIRTNFFGWSKKNNKLSDIIVNNLRNNIKTYLYDDYFFTPIYVGCLLKNLLKCLNKKLSGVYNIAGEERISKYHFGILVAECFELDKKFLIREKAKKNKFLTRRCLDLSLSNKKLKKIIKISIPSIYNQISYFKSEEKKIKNFFNKKFYYGRHSINSDDIKSVAQVMKSGSLTQGPKILESEKFIQNYVGAKYAVAVSSATAGLHISYLAIGLGNNQKVLTSANTFVSTSNAAIYSGGKVLFADVNQNDANISIESMKKLYIKNKIKIIVPVHFGGMPADIKKIHQISRKETYIIEDAAHALGARYLTGEKVGCCKYSDICVFSFHPVKIIAGGEGGMITTNSKEIYIKLLQLRSHGINKLDNKFFNKKESQTNGKLNPWYYEMQKLGFHYRQTDIHSALILSQLKRINLFLSKRREIAERYDSFFFNKKNIEIVQFKSRRFSSNHLYILRFKFKNLKITRLQLMNYLQKCGIYTQVHYIPVPIHPYYKRQGHLMNHLNNAIAYYNECLSIPIYYDLTKSEQEFVQSTILEYIEYNSF
jgi:UDP-4-amino-4,6-dideoxy-N-acetyl-beta-L-altrosamine transaminase/dTDP-4-dehydrorhamnose reductase